MKETLNLTKMLLSANFGFSKMAYDVKNDPKKLGMPLLVLFVFASMIPVYVLYMKLLKSIYLQLFVLGQEGTVFAILFSGASIIVLFFGMIYAMSTYYFSKDLDRLLFLPLKEESIIMAKFINMIIYEYLIIIPLVLPAVIIAFEDMGGILYLIYFIVGALLVPVIPLSIGTMLVMALMKFINLEGKKDMLRTISMFAILIVILGIQLLINKAATSIPPGSEAEFLEAMLRNENSMVNMVGKSYPPAIWISKALYGSSTLLGAGNFLLYVAISIGFGAAMIRVGRKFYIEGYFNRGDMTSKRSKVDYNDEIRARRIWQSIFLNDMRIVMRTPVYLFNCVSIVVLLPVILIMMPLLSGTGEMDIFTGLYVGNEKLFALILIGVFVFVAGTNPTQSTTVSREGSASWINMVLPIRKKDMFIGRLLFPLLLQSAAMVFFIIGIYFIIKPGIATVVISFIGGFFASLPVIAFGLIVDTWRPKLDWDDPQKAVKQNMNVIFNMLGAILYVLGVGFGAYALIFKVGLAIEVIIAFIIILGVVLTGAEYKLFKNIG
ncbi:putative ABC transporter permease subunit [Alkalibacter mobilis]|uniref:putative ABC transporter permease subunit n=1 Tax=Alkalibacter mobilis TaxID=2787712 RepID=UPI001CEC22F2|nr:hypothetical protein [Alkalibacter mobilis]